MTKHKKVRKNPVGLLIPALEYSIPVIVAGVTYLVTQAGQSTIAKPPSADPEKFKKLVKELLEEHGDNYFLEQPKDLFYLDKPLEYVNTALSLGYSNRAKVILIGDNVGEWSYWNRKVKSVEWLLHQYTRPISQTAFKDFLGPLNFLYFSKKLIPFAPWIGLAIDVVADQDIPEGGKFEAEYNFSVPSILKGFSGESTVVSATSQPPSYYKSLRTTKAVNRSRIARMIGIPADKATAFYPQFVSDFFNSRGKRLIAFYLKFLVFRTREYWRQRYDAFCRELDKKQGINVGFFADRYTTWFNKPSPDPNTHFRLLVEDILSQSDAYNFDAEIEINLEPDIEITDLREPTIEEVKEWEDMGKEGFARISKKAYRKTIKGFRNYYKQTVFNIRKNFYPIDELRICSAGMWVLMQKIEDIVEQKKYKAQGDPKGFVFSEILRSALEDCFEDMGFGYILKKMGASLFFNFVDTTSNVGLLQTYQFIQTYVPEVIDYLALGFLKTIPGYTIDEKYIHFAEMFLDGAFCCEVEDRNAIFIDSADANSRAVNDIGNNNPQISSFVSGAVFYKKG